MRSKLDGTSTNERMYVWGAGLDELLCFGSESSGNWTKYFAHQDRMGSTHRMVDASGAEVEECEYDPYGRPTVTALPGKTLTGNPYLWTGRRFDPETGWYYFRNRYYSPALGRFVTEDPLGVWEDIAHFGNPYAYAGNSPFVFFDPFGLQTEAQVARLQHLANQVGHRQMRAAQTAGPGVQTAAGRIVRTCMDCHGNPVAMWDEHIIGAMAHLSPEELERALDAVDKVSGLMIDTGEDILTTVATRRQRGGSGKTNCGPNGGRRSPADQKRLDDQRKRRADRRENESRDETGQNRSGEGYRDHESANRGPRGQRPSRPGGRNRERNIGIEDEHSRVPKGKGSLGGKARGGN